MKIRVYYEDTDAGGIVYHSNYLNFCERARSEAFFSQNLNPMLEKSHFVVKKLEANYIQGSQLGDMLDIQTTLIDIRSASLTLQQAIYKEEKKIFEMKIILAHISFDGKPIKIDTYTKDLLKNIFVS